MNLATVPPEEWNQIASGGFDAVWFMGVWERSGWPDNQSHLNLVAWCWRKDDDRYLIVVNLSGASAQALVRIPWDDVKGKFWQLADVFSGDVYKRNGDEMQEQGL